jgi:CRISPR-associated endonuclease/helicase Cas3
MWAWASSDPRPTVTELASIDFASFFEAIHRNPPFPWQSRLAARVAEAGWPAVLDLPTGTGKTAAIDVAVFHLALEATREQRRRAPLRIVYVVDRRTIVDQAYERARKIADAIAGATDGVLVRVRDALAGYGREGKPLMTALLRGAIAKSDAWARCPDQPLVAVSTVDQVGSRLLFRGYGVSDAMKPVHAGLLGNDVLFLLDEVHLSEPFRQTLSAIKERYGIWGDAALPRRFEVVEMSATPGKACEQAFQLDEADRAHPLLAKRLGVRKPVSLKPCTSRQFLGEAEKAVEALLEQAGPTVAVVVNRVASARELHQRLVSALDAEVRLVTGRMRPIDREQLERDLVPRICAGRKRTAADARLVVVATQCIEAGADFDFDGLVSECASLDALRQRFGRLDRLGEHGGARGVIIARSDTLKDDPVYGNALGATWEWLRAQAGDGGEVDFGLGGLKVPEHEAARPLLAPRERAPVMLPAHLDAWVQTSPRPTPDPDVALWLHGPERGVADVQVIWRADLSEVALHRALDDADGAHELCMSVVETVPPASAEAMAVPFNAVRRWLAGQSEPELFDIEGAREPEDERPRDDGSRPPRPALVWRGDESVITPGDLRDRRLRPGDTIIVPTSYGGIAAGTWAPAATEAPLDRAEVVTARQRARAILRLHPGVLSGFGVSTLPAPPKPSAFDTEEVEDENSVREWLRAAAEGMAALDSAALDIATTTLRLIVDHLRDVSKKPRSIQVERVRCVRLSDEDPPVLTELEYFVITSRRRLPVTEDDAGEATTEDDSASFTGVEVTLAKHMHGVGDIAEDFGRRLGLPATVVADVKLAGRWHDIGKADPRFQRLLHGGSEFKALVAPEPIAKSRTPVRSRQARLRAAKLSGYPKGARHEVASVALLATAQAELRPKATDWELVLHLAATHHGRCRPLAPWAPDPEPVSIAWWFDGTAVAGTSNHGLERLDSGIGDRFWTLVRRYGWWGLAWLEVVLRLADHRRSEWETQQKQIPEKAEKAGGGK